MKRNTITTFSMTFAVALAFTGVANAGLWTAEHGDVGLAYEGGDWDLHYHLEEEAVVDGSPVGGGSEGMEFEPDDITVFVPDPSGARPAGAQWDPIGVGAGGAYWFIPEVEDIAKPYVGIGAEEIEAGDFVGDTFSLTLTGFSGPGDFSLWDTDTFGDPTFYMSTADGVSAGDVLNLNAGDHAHYGWGFTATGLYELEFTAAGNHSIDGQVSGTATYKFLVAPEPASLALLGIGGISVLRRRKRA